MVTICGIDEAGRGPLIGPLVIAGVMIDKKDEAIFREIGCKDSKMLSGQQRELLFDVIKAKAQAYHIVTLTPKDVDNALNDEDMNLNWLEAVGMARILNELKPDEAILDAPSNNIPAYVEYVKKLIKEPCKITAEHKADETYPVVSAASILAKVTRDLEIQKIQKEIGENFGSGYPSDSRTQAFAKKNWNKYPDIFRKTWATYQKIVKAQGQKKIGEY